MGIGTSQQRKNKLDVGMNLRENVRENVLAWCTGGNVFDVNIGA